MVVRPTFPTSRVVVYITHFTQNGQLWPRRHVYWPSTLSVPAERSSSSPRKRWSWRWVNGLAVSLPKVGSLTHCFVYYINPNSVINELLTTMATTIPHSSSHSLSWPLFVVSHSHSQSVSHSLTLSWPRRLTGRARHSVRYHGGMPPINRYPYHSRTKNPRGRGW